MGLKTEKKSENIDVEIKKPLLRKGGSRKFVPHVEVKPKSSFALFSTLVVAMGPLSYGLAFSLFGSLVTVGAMLGAIASGSTADFLGRKGALAVSAIPIIIGWVTVAIAQGVDLLYLARFLVGIGIGISSFTVPIYIAETAPRHLRGTLGTMNQLFITIGIMLVYMGGLFLNWRTLAAVGVLMVIGLFFIPETPRWLAKAGLKDQLYTSLQKLRGRDFDITTEVMDIQAGVGLLLLQQLSGINAVMLYAGQIFREVGVSSANAASFGLGSLQVVMTFVTAGLVERAGRRLLLMVSAGGMAFTSFLVGFSFYFKDIGGAQLSIGMSTFVNLLALFSLLVYVLTFSLGVGPVPWIVMGEVCVLITYTSLLLCDQPAKK